MSSSCDDSGEDNFCHSEGAAAHKRGWAVAPSRAFLRDEIEVSVLKSRLDAAAAKNELQSITAISGLSKFISSAFKSASNICGPGSNIPYVSLLLSAVEQWPDVCSVQASCGFDTVDVVSSRGLRWTLLSAASPRRLPRVFKQGLSHKIVRLFNRARQFPVLHSIPRIFFYSLHPLPKTIRSWLNTAGVSVCGSRGPGVDMNSSEDVENCDDQDDCGAEAQPADSADSCFPMVAELASTHYEEYPAFPLWCMSWTPSLLELASSNFSHTFAPPASFLLDVTACIALVSAITADDTLLRLPASSFSIEFSRWQHGDEQRVCQNYGCSTRSLIMRLLNNGDRVTVCCTAWQVFNSIVDTIGGPSERLRRDGLLSQIRCEVIPDAPCCALEGAKINLGKKKDTNTLVTVATAVATKSVLVTSNMGFLNAAWQTSRIHVPAVVHPARALFKS